MSEPIATPSTPEPKITVVIDFPETPGEFHPVIGRSGLHLGLALHDSKRGCKSLRIPLEQFRLLREDIFACKRNGQYPIPDVEVEFPEAPTDLSDPTDLTDLPQEGMTTSEAGAILGNGIAEPEDAEAARVLAEKARSEAPKKPKKQPKAAQ